MKTSPFTKAKLQKARCLLWLGEATIFLPLAGVIDVEAENARLGKNLEKVQKEIAGIAGRLNNEKFVAKAPDHVIAENRKEFSRS